MRMPVKKEDNNEPCLEVFVFDKEMPTPEILENLQRYAESVDNMPGSYLILDKYVLHSAVNLLHKALKDIEAPKDDDTIN